MSNVPQKSADGKQEYADLENPMVRSALVIMREMVGHAADYGDTMACGCCGHISERGSSEQWSGTVLGFEGSTVKLVFLCNECSGKDLSEHLSVLSTPLDDEMTLKVAISSMERAAEKGNIAVMHAFANSGRAWYSIPCVGGRIALNGPGHFYSDYGVEQICMQTSPDSKADTVVGARIALGKALGLCTVDSYIDGTYVNVDGDLYRGPIPLPKDITDTLLEKAKGGAA